MCYVGAEEPDMHSGHSLKRGATQRYRSIENRAKQITEIVQLSGDQVFSKNFEAYNSYAQYDLRKLSNLDSYLAHVKPVKKNKKF